MNALGTNTIRILAARKVLRALAGVVFESMKTISGCCERTASAETCIADSSMGIDFNSGIVDAISRPTKYFRYPKAATISADPLASATILLYAGISPELIIGNEICDAVISDTAA